MEFVSSIVEINKYAVFDYVYAYAPRNWTFSGSYDQHQWIQLDRQDEPPVDHIFKKYEYYLNNDNNAYPYYRYTILGMDDCSFITR